MRNISISQLSIGAMALLCGLGVGGGLLAEAQAQISCGQTLRPGGTYVLNKDLLLCSTNPALTVNAASLDLQGHTVSCASTAGNGIVLKGQGARIKNGTITGCARGVLLSSKGKHVVQGMDVHDNASDGFRVSSVSNTLDNNTAHNNAGDGFHLTSDNNRLDNNTALWNSQDGFDLDTGNGQNQLFGNVASNNGTQGFDIDTDYNRLSGNTASWNFENGFYLLGNYNVLSTNTTQDNTTEGIDVNADNNQLTSNMVSNNVQDGIKLGSGASGNLVKSNDVENNGARGIIVRGGATKNSLDHNTALGNNVTYDLEDDNSRCDSNTWSSNTFGTASQPCIH